MDINLEFETYDEIILYYKNNPIDKSVYTESHHIIPKSEGGEDSDIVELPYQVHAFAHFLRAKEMLKKKNYKFAYSNINAARLIISAQEITFDSDIDYVKNLIMKVYKDYAYYVTNGEVSFRVYKDQIDSFLKNNPDFRVGRTFRTPSGRKWVNNGVVQTYIDADKVDKFLIENPSYHIGMLPLKEKKKFKDSYKGSTIGRKWIHKGSIRKNVFPDEIDTYISLGWEIGSGNHGKRHHNPDKKFVTGYRWMHNDTLRMSKQVNPQKIEELESQGWVLGRVTYSKD